MNKAASFILYSFILIFVFACSETEKTNNQDVVKKDTILTDFMFSAKTDTLIENGEYVTYHKNGTVEMKGQMKNGKREGVWKSYYMDGSPWSETTFSAGVKNGKTISWYDNENKRYEGFYTDGKESGKWTFWNENGTEELVKDYK